MHLNTPQQIILDINDIKASVLVQGQGLLD